MNIFNKGYCPIHIYDVIDMNRNMMDKLIQELSILLIYHIYQKGKIINKGKIYDHYIL